MKRLSYDKPFSDAIRFWRKETGLSLRDAAEKMGVSFTYLSKIENGRLPAPSAATLEAMAATYDVPRHDVFLRAKKIPPEWETLLYDPATFYAVAETIHNMNLPRQVYPDPYRGVSAASREDPTTSPTARAEEGKTNG